jgi:hypothetical protein
MPWSSATARRTLFASIVLATSAALGLTSQGPPPLGARDFTQAAIQGFGDRHNSWPWAMQWWNGSLYVGTYRATACVEQFELQQALGPVLFPYPPPDPYVECTADPADLPLQAEIWRLTPPSGQWERLYQSPNDVPNPDRPGKFVPRDMAYRTMTVYREPGGSEALYVGGVTTKAMWHGGVPAPRLLRSTDGVTFSPVPADAGTVMGDLPNATFRSLTSFNGQLFVINGIRQGSGIILASSNPSAGNDAWQQISPAGLYAFELEVFNGWLYVGVFDPVNGYALLKTRATGTPPYSFVPVIDHGGELPSPSDFVTSLSVFDGRLHVGTGAVLLPGKPTEIVRVDADDTWDLLVGPPRQTAQGMKRPLSGIGDGFANGFNDHVWRMAAQNGTLYAGTYDSSTYWRVLPLVASRLQPLLGGDLYRTPDGRYFSPVTMNGFGDPFSFGFRNFADTPGGLFVGAANPFSGLRIWRGQAAAPRIGAPQRVEVEMSAGRPVLTWRGVAGAARYDVWRARLQTITQYPGLLGQPLVPGQFAQIATVLTPLFADQPAPEGAQFLYLVVAQNAAGQQSDPSNVVQAPSLAEPETFMTLLALIDTLHARGHFLSEAAAFATSAGVQQAQFTAAGGDIPGAITQLVGLQQQVLLGTTLAPPYTTDLEIAMERLVRRLSLLTLGVTGHLPLH